MPESQDAEPLEICVEGLNVESAFHLLPGNGMSIYKANFHSLVFHWIMEFVVL
jgi:hypothetical protein